MKKKNLKFIFIFILIAIFVVYFLRINFAEYNLKRTISACIVAKKRTSKTFNLQEAKKFCEDEIKRQKEE